MTIATIDRTDAVARTNAISPTQAEWTSEQMAMLSAIGVDPDTPQPDLKVFLHQCQRTGLDPFARQIYLIGRWDSRAQAKRYTIQTGIDGLRVVAARSADYAGQTEPQWCGPDGVWRDVWPERTAPVAARVGVYRNGFAVPLYATAHFDEYCATDRNGKPTGMWRSMPRLMIAKVAEALALRKAFPQDLSGLYISEEMDADRTQSAPAAPAAQPVGRQRPPQPKPGVAGDQSYVTGPAEEVTRSSEIDRFRDRVKQSVAKVAGDLDKLQRLHSWASDPARYDEQSVRMIEAAIRDAQQTASDDGGDENVVDEDTDSRVEVGGFDAEEWEGYIEDAAADGDVETMAIHVSTLERLVGSSHRLTKIARAALAKMQQDG